MKQEASPIKKTVHQYEALIQELINCATACENCASSCLNEADVTTMAPCIKIDRDCTEICSLVARLLMRGSDYAPELLGFCEKVCNLCAEECEKHAHEHCKKCAAACRQCAAACGKYR